MTIWRVRIACWITKATNIHSEYVIHIAFPLQQWLHERASVTLQYISCAADNLCRFPSTLCGLSTFRGASYRTDICC